MRAFKPSDETLGFLISFRFDPNQQRYPLRYPFHVELTKSVVQLPHLRILPYWYFSIDTGYPQLAEDSPMKADATRRARMRWFILRRSWIGFFWE